MSFVRLESSQLHSAQYEPVEQKLRIRFLCSSCRGANTGECAKCNGAGWGSEYEYPQVGVDKWTQIRDAKKTGGSVGGSFHRLIKSQPKVHPHTRIR